MEKIKVRLKEHTTFYIHNDLANTAFYFKQRIEERLAKDDREGIALEMMACLTMIAFAIEAKANFLGLKLIDPWDDRLPTIDKLKEVAKAVGADADFGRRPYQTVQALKQFRDTLAHGKPIEVNNEKELITTQDDLLKRDYLTSPWNKYLEIGFLTRAYDDITTIWRDLLNRSGLEIFETLTNGGSSVEFIEHVKK